MDPNRIHPGGPLVSCCAVCQSRETLGTCRGCKAIKYCSRAHQNEHWDQHKIACKAIKETRKESEDMYQSVINDPGAPSIGQLGSTTASYEYILQQLKLVQALTLPLSREGINEGLELMLEMLHLGRREPKAHSLRFMIPFSMLLLNQDQECYDFIKWWEVNKDGYAWDDSALGAAPYLERVGANALEPVDVISQSDTKLTSLVSATLIKVKLSIDLKGWKNAQLSNMEFIPRSNTFHQVRAMLDTGNWDSHMETLDAQITTLVEATQERNPFYWKALLNPIFCVQIDTLDVDPILVNEMRQVLDYSMGLWMASTGAIDYIRSRYKAEWNSG